MSGYRDETEALKARNQSLEAELAATKTELERLKAPYPYAPTTTSGGSSLGCALAAAGFVVVGIASAAAVSMLLRRAAPPASPFADAPLDDVITDSPPMPPATPAPRVPWEGAHGAILVDLNGDGTPEIIGRVRYMPRDDTVHAAAFDGETGVELWETPSLGPYISTLQGRLMATRTALFFASEGGALTAFDTLNGEQRWEAMLPERAIGMCIQGEVLSVRLADGKLTSIGVADGAPVTNQAKPPNCVELPSDAAQRSNGPLSDRDIKVDGMNTTMSAFPPGGPKVVLGTRWPGTRVPMVAGVFDDPKRSWKTELAEKDALLTRETIPETGLAVTHQGIFTLYAPTSGIEELHLVGLDFAGHHLWDVAFSGRSPFVSLQADDKAVFVSQWGRLGAYDPATGKLLFEIGKGLFP